MTRPTPKPAPARRAFTLLEVLIVVVLIGILSTLLLIGVEKLIRNARTQQTRVTLEHLRSMYADYDAVAHLHFSPAAMPCPQNMTADYNPVPSAAAQANDAPAMSTMPAATRYGAAVWFTRDVMFNLRSTPANAAALAKFPSASLMTMPTPLSLKFPEPYYDQLQIQGWMAADSYTPFYGDVTKTLNTFGRVALVVPSVPIDATHTKYTFYDCIQAVAASNTTSPDRGHWLPAYPVVTVAADGTITTDDNSVPVVLDAWGDPIIFVAGGILGTGNPLSTGAGIVGTVVAGSGSMRSGTGASALTIRATSPDGRPFFASAGPGGDFSNGDGNLYSYEK